MSDQHYEYRRFELDLNSVPHSHDYNPIFPKVQVQHVFQPLGNDAWEVMYIKKDYYSSRRPWVEARRPPYGTPAPSSWEYTAFNVAGMPHPQWDEHIASRGWVRLPEVWFQYYFHEWWVYKRPDVWRGTDDGDIMSQFHARRIYFGGDDKLRSSNKVITIENAVRSILEFKWQASEARAYDIGTYAAVKHWIDNFES